MTQVATPQSVAASFDGVRVGGRAPMVLEQRGDELWAEFDDPDRGQGRWSRDRCRDRCRDLTRSHKTPGGDDHRIAQSADLSGTRPGQGRMLGQLPAIWLVAERRWIPRRAAVMHPPGQAAVLGNRQLERHLRRLPHDPRQARVRHAVRIAADRVADRWTPRAAEFGIACEACHGPADEHVRSQSPTRCAATRCISPAGADADASSSRRGSSRGARRRSAASATRSGSSTITAAERDANAHGLPYRPGDELRADALHRPADRERRLADRCKRFLAGRPGLHPRHVLVRRHGARDRAASTTALIDSPCYKNATDDRAHADLLLVPHDAQTADDRRADRASGRTIS